MASNSATFGGSIGYKFHLVIESHEVQVDYANNRSLIEVTLYVHYDGGTYAYNYGPGPTWSINGSGIGSAGGGWSYNYGSGAADTYFVNNNQYWIGHDNNGNASVSFSASCNMDNSPYVTTAGTSLSYGLTSIYRAAPSVTTNGSSSVTNNSAVLGGTVNSDNNVADYERGVAWATTANPTTGNSHASSGSGTGGYAITATGLAENTTYHYRAYSINSMGTGYGSDAIFTTKYNPPTNITYSGPNSYPLTIPITPLTPTVTATHIDSWSISPALPSGLSFDTTTGIISGTPTVITPMTTYTVTATNNGGSGTGTVQIATIATTRIQLGKANIKNTTQRTQTGKSTVARNSQYLKLTNFGINIPSGATITGVVVEVIRKSSAANSITDNSIRLIKGGVVVGDNKATNTFWDTNNETVYYGSYKDAWNASLTPSDITASNFGVALSAQSALTGVTGSIDYINITVYHAVGGIFNSGNYNYPNLRISSGRVILNGNSTYGSFETDTNTVTTITGSNTFTAMNMEAGTSLILGAGTTQTVTTLSGYNGTNSENISIISDTEGQQANLNLGANNMTVSWWNVRDINVTGGAQVIAYRSLDYGDNTNIIFKSNVEKYYTYDVFTKSSTTTSNLTQTVSGSATAMDNSVGTGLWTNMGNVYVDDATYASGDISTSGKITEYLKVTGFNLNIPTDATINGIVVNIKRYGASAEDNSIRLIQGGVITGNDKAATTTAWPTSEAVATYGSTTDIWGVNWQPSDLNSNSFGVAISVKSTAASATAYVDFVQIIVSYTATVDSAAFLGQYNDVINDPDFSLQMNSAGAQMQIRRGVDPTDFGEGDIVDFNNKVEVKVFSEDYPNGEMFFQGYISSYQPNIEPDNHYVDITLLSYGAELSQYLAITDPSVDVHNASDTTSVYPAHSGSDNATYLAQKFTTGAGATNLSAIQQTWFEVADGFGDQTIHYEICPDNAGSPNRSSVLQSGILSQFTNFAPAITTTASTAYWLVMYANDGRGVNSYSCVTGSSGNKLRTSSDGVTWADESHGYTSADFKTYSSLGNTTVSYNNTNIRTAILDIISNYNLQGGTITADDTTVDDTGTTMQYIFQSATIGEALQKCVDLSPAGYYWYVDVATNKFHFHQMSATPVHVLTLGRDIMSVQLQKTMETVVNTVLITGGDDGSGYNLFRTYFNQASISRYGKRTQVYNDGRITLTATADAIANKIIAQNKEATYRAPVTILGQPGFGYNLESIKPGDTFIVQGVANAVMLQISRVDYKAIQVDVDASTIPPQINNAVADSAQAISEIQVGNNPTYPTQVAID